MKITEALVAEHNIFLAVFDEIERALPNLNTQKEVSTMAHLVLGLLESHAKTETDIAYLALDHVMEQKGELTHMHQDHHEIDDRLRQVFTAKAGTEARKLLKAALLASRDHFSAEERNVFPFMEKVLRKETLMELGQSWLQRSPQRAQPA